MVIVVKSLAARCSGLRSRRLYAFVSDMCLRRLPLGLGMAVAGMLTTCGCGDRVKGYGGAWSMLLHIYLTHSAGTPHESAIRRDALCVSM